MQSRPHQIGRYRIEGLLGKGAMGIVYKAHDPHIDRTVAIKLVRADLLDGESRGHYLSRFRNEARMAGRCIHPNIVGIHDFSEHDGNPFLVLEYVDGHDLGRAFPRGMQAGLPQASTIVLQVLDALGYAHQFGVIHRDIKPANILLSAASGLKVTDFGISRAMSAEATMSSVLVGTPCYMSPEQCRGGDIDERSDLFSLGCVFYELLSGQRAFNASNYVATMHALINDAPTPLVSLRDDLPDRLIQLVDRALEKKPADRFRTAAEMSEALRIALDLTHHNAAADDSTVVLWPAGPARSATPTARIEGSLKIPPASQIRDLSSRLSPTMATVERRLAHHVGPMARYHLRQAIETARSSEALCAQLADILPDQSRRSGFIQEISALLAQDAQLPATITRDVPPLPNPGILDQPAIERVQQALARVMGPIAQQMLRRVLLTVNDVPSLRDACAGLIELPQERQRFLDDLDGRTNKRSGRN
jgi:serine/threonine-protein kinase